VYFIVASLVVESYRASPDTAKLSSDLGNIFLFIYLPAPQNGIVFG
jgi:hypothetical protein